jgi:hypothetical protein
MRKKHIPMEARIVMALTRLGSGNSSPMCVKVHGIAKSTTSIIMREFCVTIKNHLEPLLIPKFTKKNFKEITSSFECLHGIPYILGAINDSHVPIITPKKNLNHIIVEKVCTTHEFKEL